MTRRFLSLFTVGAVALTALPAFAQDASSSSSANSASSESSVSSVGSSSSASSSSEQRRVKQNNLGQAIKSKCSEISGKSREQCVHNTIKDHKMRGKPAMMKKIMKPMKKTCSEFAKGSSEFKSCLSSEKEKMKKNPAGIMKKVENMRMKYRNKGIQ